MQLGFLDIGGVIAAAAIDDGSLAGFGDDHELVAALAADGAGIGLHRAVCQAATGENAAVSVIHLIIALIQAGFVAVEGIKILHDELAAAHQAEPRPDLVAELVLDLVQHQRQLPV